MDQVHDETPSRDSGLAWRLTASYDFRTDSNIPWVGIECTISMRQTLGPNQVISRRATISYSRDAPASRHAADDFVTDLDLDLWRRCIEWADRSQYPAEFVVSHWLRPNFAGELLQKTATRAIVSVDETETQPNSNRRASKSANVARMI